MHTMGKKIELSIREYNSMYKHTYKPAKIVIQNIDNINKSDNQYEDNFSKLIESK